MRGKRTEIMSQWRTSLYYIHPSQIPLILTMQNLMFLSFSFLESYVTFWESVIKPNSTWNKFRESILKFPDDYFKPAKLVSIFFESVHFFGFLKVSKLLLYKTKSKSVDQRWYPQYYSHLWALAPPWPQLSDYQSVTPWPMPEFVLFADMDCSKYTRNLKDTIICRRDRNQTALPSPTMSLIRFPNNFACSLPVGESGTLQSGVVA